MLGESLSLHVYLIKGDRYAVWIDITGPDGSLFHSRPDVHGRPATLRKIADLTAELDVRQVLLAHLGPLSLSAAGVLLNRAAEVIDEIESTLIRIAAGLHAVTLENLWAGVCTRMERLRAFHALNMTFAHVRDLVDHDLLREVGPETYPLR